MTTKDEIIQVLRETDEPISPVDISERLGGINLSTVHTHLHSLNQDGKIKRPSRGMYILSPTPTNGDTESPKGPGPGNRNLQFRLIAELDDGMMLLQFAATSDFFVAKMIDIKEVLNLKSVF